MLVVGLISGTSVDGIDAALVEIKGQPPSLELQLIHAITVPYDREMRERILHVCDAHLGLTPDVCVLNFSIGEAFSDLTMKLLREANVSESAVSFIGSHGQTIWHEVSSQGDVIGTLQIGSAAVIAERTGITTISNLRARDVAAGGQGAPFAAIFDWLMLRLPQDWRAIVNIGGIGNVTFLPPRSDEETAPLALDTGPGCGMIDSIISYITQGEKTFDENGMMAASGMVDEEWLNELLALPYFQIEPPKTTGRELFSRTLAKEWLNEGRQRDLKDQDIVATVTALTASSIAHSVRLFSPVQPSELIVAGGGTENSTLLSMLREQLPDIPMRRHDELGYRAEFKEAMFFALLAYESWHGRASWHPAVTGARHASILGDITPGKNYPDLIRDTWSLVSG